VRGARAIRGFGRAAADGRRLSGHPASDKLGNDLEKPLRALLFVIALGMAAGSAQAGSLRIAGTAGYLSEWEMNADVTEAVSAGLQEFSGPVTWKHVGLCSPNGPEEKSGKIKFRISGLGSSSQIQATLSLEGAQCTYSGKWSDSSSGLMDCSDAKGVPLTLSVK
jgi:hypothetical protein